MHASNEMLKKNKNKNKLKSNKQKKVAKRVDLKCPHHKEKKYFLQLCIGDRC